MRTSLYMTILAGLMVAACASQAQMPGLEKADSMSRLVPQPKEAMRIRLTDRLDLGLFVMDAPAPGSMDDLPGLSRELLDVDQMRTLMGTFGYGAGLRLAF